MRLLTPLLAFLPALSIACTTLGPTPATTGLSARPIARGGAEVQAGVMPGHYLSSAVVEAPAAAGIPQLSAVVEVGQWVDAPGLVVGARAFGQDGDAPIEPVVGYRRELGADGRAALAGFAYGTRARANDNGATYTATRVGGELSADVRVTARSRWLEPHLLGGLNVTYLDARGTYCTDAAMRWGHDCAAPGDPPAPSMTATIDGAFVAGNVGAAAEFLRNRRGWFRGGRLAATAAAGLMPRLEGGRRTGDEAYAAVGLSLSLAVGDVE